MSEILRGYLQGCPVLPVLTFDSIDTAVPVARALVAGGLRMLEVTLRTPVSMQAVERIARDVPEAVVGVGSVIEPGQFASAQGAGARFAVSPGATHALHGAAAASGMPWMPGVQTVSEILELRALGYRLLKVFPAASIGGVPFLKSVAGPVTDMIFCPTGGITAQTAPQYLALANVACVGGSWLTPDAPLTERRWAVITQLAREACALRTAN